MERDAKIKELKDDKESKIESEVEKQKNIFRNFTKKLVLYQKNLIEINEID